MKTSRSAALSLVATAAVSGAMVAGLAGGGAAVSAEPHYDRAAVMKALDDCRKITEDTARLACFDKASAAFDQAETQGQVVVIDREQVKTVRRQAFGFNLPALHIFDRTARNEEGIDRLDLDISATHRDANGHWVLETTDKAVWRQTDDQTLVRDPKPGSKLHLRAGALGSYFCKVDTQEQFRCQRVS